LLIFHFQRASHRSYTSLTFSCTRSETPELESATHLLFFFWQSEALLHFHSEFITHQQVSSRPCRYHLVMRNSSNSNNISCMDFTPLSRNSLVQPHWNARYEVSLAEGFALVFLMHPRIRKRHTNCSQNGTVSWWTPVPMRAASHKQSGQCRVDKADCHQERNLGAPESPTQELQVPSSAHIGTSSRL
jgi:hypothetical protein